MKNVIKFLNLTLDYGNIKKCSFEEIKEEAIEIKEEAIEDIDYKLLLLKMMEQNNELQNTIITFYNNYKNP